VRKYTLSKNLISTFFTKVVLSFSKLPLICNTIQMHISRWSSTTPSNDCQQEGCQRWIGSNSLRTCCEWCWREGSPNVDNAVQVQQFLMIALFFF